MWHVDEIVEFSENDIVHQTKSNCIVINMWLVVLLYNTSNNIFLVSIGPLVPPSAVELNKASHMS
jgi:hypothetical protein